MKALKGRIVLAVLLAGCLGYSTLAWAEFRFTPGIGIREEYNDNVNSTAGNKQEDFITTINPTFNLYYSRSFMDVYLDYGFRYLLYARDTEDDQMYNNVNLQWTIRPFKDYVFIKVSDFFSRVPIDQRGPVGYENNQANLTNENVFSVNPYLEYPLSGTLKVKAGYAYQNTWYESNEGNDSEDHTFTAGISKELTSRVNASLFYSYILHRPKISLDTYDRQGATLGLDCKLSEKFMLDGTVGWVDFAYDQQDYRDFSSIPWSVNASYLLSPALKLQAGYSIDYIDSSSQTPATAGSFTSPAQGIIYPGEGYVVVDGQQIPTSALLLDSIGGGLYRNEIFTVGLTYSGKITVSVTGFRDTSTYENINREDKSTGVNLNASIPLTSQITTQLGGYYSYNEYRPDNEKVNRYGARLALDYAYSITTLTLGYAYNREDSNFAGQSYTNNIVWIGARFVF